MEKKQQGIKYNLYISFFNNDNKTNLPVSTSTFQKDRIVPSQVPSQSAHPCSLTKIYTVGWSTSSFHLDIPKNDIIMGISKNWGVLFLLWNCVYVWICPGYILLILWRITKLFGINVYHDGMVCHTQHSGLQLKGQGHT